jgi:hypothetical protein
MSSDSDFYHIATFIRSVGKTIICYGEEKTPQMLRNVVDEFILCKTPLKVQIKKIDLTKKIDLSKKIQIKKVDLIKKEVTDLDKYDINNSLDEEEDNTIELSDEEKIYEEITKIDKYVVESEKIKNINWKKYDYYIEYKDKIYIIRDIIEKIRFIITRKNLINKNLSLLKDLLKLSDSSFTETNWNFNSFKLFIQTLFINKIELNKDLDKKYETIVNINL